MADPKDTTSFFRKVVKFVANPATDWAEIDAPPEDTRESEYAKGELKAMIERKRRNDFVRKREFDMLRKVRREGLSSEQLAALGGSSRIDESEPRLADSRAAPRQRRQGEDRRDRAADGRRPRTRGTARRGPEFFNAPTQPAPLTRRSPRHADCRATASAAPNRSSARGRGAAVR